MISHEQIATWLSAREDEHVEFKEAKESFSFDELTRYTVALAGPGPWLPPELWAAARTKEPMNAHKTLTTLLNYKEVMGDHVMGSAHNPAHNCPPEGARAA